MVLVVGVIVAFISATVAPILISIFTAWVLLHVAAAMGGRRRGGRRWR